MRTRTGQARLGSKVSTLGTAKVAALYQGMALAMPLEFLHLDSQRAAVDNGPLQGERVRRSRG